MYSNTDDIERARKRKLDEINLVIVELKRRIINVEQRLDKTQLQAANYERKGEEVPADLRIEVANMQNTIRESEKALPSNKSLVAKPIKNLMRCVRAFVYFLVQLRHAG